MNFFLGILGLLGASAMGFSMGVSARVIFAPAADRNNHRRGAEKAEDSEEKKKWVLTCHLDAPGWNGVTRISGGLH
ncbi:MAG TPA: hypothetical protein VK188_15700 [Holophaga sp.]|nr:hypothetical protein [Holophaga sp.]